MDAAQLYRLPPEQFTAVRDTEARQRRADGDKDGAAAVKALRRPSVAAWLVNRLAGDSPEVLEDLLALGPGLAQAQAGGDAAALRALGAQRRALVRAVTGAAVAAGGRAVTAAVREELVATLEAALSDPASAEAVRSGRLVRSLSYAGFGEVDLSGAVAPAGRRAPAPPARDRPHTPRLDAAARAREQHAARLAEAQQAAHDAAGVLDDAVRARGSAQHAHAQAQAAVVELAAEVERRAAALAEARQEHEQAGHHASITRREADRAAAKVEQAQARAEAVRAELDRLRHSGPSGG